MPLRKLEPVFHERVWGTRKLEPWFPDAHAQFSKLPVGEVWFHTPEVPVLAKFLFTTDNLSVQVHPGDAYAQLHHNSPGKTEMWHVLAAEKGAKIAAGFREPVTVEQVRAAALNGSIVHLLQWFEAQAGDTFFIPAGTVHAIGAGLTICEIQQPSDITYRLYDYDRGRGRGPLRELHLDQALAVSHLGPHAARTAVRVACPGFVTEPLDVAGSLNLPPATRNEFLIAIQGEGKIDGQRISCGDVFLITASPNTTEIAGALHILRTSLPETARLKIPFLTL